MLYRIALIYFIFIQSLFAHTLPTTVLKSKKDLETAALIVHATSPYTFFCQQPFSTTGTVITQDCPTCPNMESKIKWFYIVPPEVFAKDLLCYQEKLCVNAKGKWYKGRSCCDKKAPLYTMMSRDLHNLMPDTPHLAKQRGHRTFMPLLEATSGCFFKLDKKAKVLYVDPNQMGLIARAYLYMMDTYSLEIPESDRKQYLTWHKAYPPSRWEILRNQKIKMIQGNENLYISFSNLDTAKDHKTYLLNPLYDVQHVD
ncbi:MAG: endonuclease [Gammaproteobacteria bacterium]